MHYFDVREEEFPKFGKPGTGIRVTVEKGDDRRVEYWGSKLCENFIQHLARDVFAWKLLDLERAGLKILWTVHDEVILEVPTKDSEEALNEVERIMSAPDPRLPGLPLAADAHLANYYDK
jgi:DNA polymerase